MKMSELFHKCAWNEVPYVEAGDDVDYAFVEEGSTLYIYFQGSISAKLSRGYYNEIR